ncbi:MAG: gluconate kinase, family [Nocardioides sp.]|jgi:gluconokinase|uniref:gluconokinase n=1 Tax=Nocardioides sp. TaxID=35761 RepID=UPI00260E65D6|nr:gluconokinase [Nocardioides sp.]MCW2835857.1 gluconate kinase, family [Nocardioides sp.]
MSAPEPAGSRPRHVVVTGVSGTGKTTVAVELAQHFGWVFVEGDDLHPPANIAKMSAGIALDDGDREPWLAALALVLARHQAGGSSSVVTCSALKRSYRDVLRARLPDATAVFFVHLAAPYDVIAARVASREHFMAPSLLRSQVDTLELLGEDEQSVVIDVSQPATGVVTEAIGAIERS